MKRIMVSVGVFAIGAAAIQTCNAQGDASKSWTFSAALRGFYDDNVNTVGNGGEIDTYGFEVSPSLGYQLPLDQTSLSLAYTFAYKYYDERPQPNSSSHDDMTHTIMASLSHAFDESTTATLKDSFVIGQEPDLLNYDSFQRLSGNNIRNFASAMVSHQFTPTLGVQGGYRNTYFNYDDPIRSATLDRVEHHLNLDGRWTLANNSVAILGYGFGLGCYTADAILGPGIMSNDRNYRAHYGYAGLEHTFRPDLVGNFRIGARYTDYYNSPVGDSSTTPYAEASLSYIYAQDSHVDVGVRHDRTASDRFSAAANSITTDSDSTVVYGSITHAITPNLTGSLLGQFQDSTLNGGTLDGQSEQFYIVSVSLKYQFTPNIAGTVSYNFDHLETATVIRGFNNYDRNRVFLGAVFSY